MRLARFSVDEFDWALIDEREGFLRHVAGGLNAWGPRIAGGEGSAALPLTGRQLPAAEASSDLRPLLLRVLDLPPSEGHSGMRIAAVVGAPLEGRRNPFRSVIGYILLDEQHRSRVLVTRDEFGAEPPRIADSAEDSADAPAGERMWELDAAWGLKPGDVVVLGTPVLDARMAARLVGADAQRALPLPSMAPPSGICLPNKAPGTLPRPRRVVPTVDGRSAYPRVDR